MRPIELVALSFNQHKGASVCRAGHRIVVTRVGHIIVIINDLLGEVMNMVLLRELLAVQRD